MSVIGQEYKQPRVFAHDAHPIIVGAINSTWNMNTKFPGTMNWGGIKVTSGGTGYAPDMVLTMTGGSGTGAVITVTAISGGGATGPVSDYTVSTVGAAYVVGDSLTQSGASAPAGGTGFTCDVTNIDIPNTQEAGCCLYIGKAAGFTSLAVIMESAVYDGSAATGYADTPISLNTLSGGAILPILVKQITTTLVANEVIALY